MWAGTLDRQDTTGGAEEWWRRRRRRESSEEKVHSLQEKSTEEELRTMAGKGQGQLHAPWELHAPPPPPPSTRSFPRIQVIHSGHFMVSSPHTDPEPRRREGGEAQRYDFDTVNRTWCQTYRYRSGSLSIDPTLTRLFECMSLAYSGRLNSPKWKSFKGLRLLWRDKIRLNNAIWRGWHIQYAERKKSSVCGFVTPLEGSEGDVHRKPQTIVLEGSYWKRRIEVVIREYHKWRIFYKKRLQRKTDDILSRLQEGQISPANLDKCQRDQEPEAAPAVTHMFDLDCLLSDVSDTLFTMTQKPFAWDNDQQDTYTSNADIIQPGATPLQPNLDDFMDIPDIFMDFRDAPIEQTGFTDFSYFQSPSGKDFAPLMDTELAQAGRLSQLSSSSTQPDHTRPVQDFSAYPLSSMASDAGPYGHQMYPNAPVSIAFTPSIQQPATASIPFLHSPSHKFGNYSTSSVTSTVITHTASTMGAQGSVQQGHGFPHMADTRPQTPCHPVGYPANVSGPPQAALPSVAAAHCFSVPKQVAIAGVRGKHKKKTGGARTVSPSIALSVPQFSAPAPTSCLAQLLASGRERNPSRGLDSTPVTAKGQRSSLPGSSQSSRSAGGAVPQQQQQQVAGWPVGLSVLTPLPGHSPQASTSSCMGASTLLAQGAAHTSTILLIPKSEKLSPVQLYGTDRSSLSVNFAEQPGRSSTPNPLDIVTNPESPQSSFSVPGKAESSKPTETRRITHISAEQKRRFNINLGFDTLQNLVTTLSSQPSTKISKATTLQKTAEYIGKMQQERAQLHEEAQRLREEIQVINSDINTFQQQLPATGVPITRQRFDHMRQKFRDYVRVQTLQNWKFWIFSVIITPLFESYNAMVSTASPEDLYRTTLSWLEQHCNLPALRPMVLNSLRQLSTTTAILTDPSLLPEQAALAVTQGDPSAAPDTSLQDPTWDEAHPM